MPKAVTTVTYGADPEFFVKEKATGAIIPGCGLFGGDKGAPIILSSMGGYLEDGVAIEFNVAPAPTIEEVRSRLLNLISMWEQRFPQHTLVDSPVAEFDKKILRLHRKAMEIGCNADLCAWGFRKAPQIRDMGTQRFTGGHIHVGIDPWPKGLDKAFFVRWLDAFAYIPNWTAANPDRFRFYGRPGLYRDTSYGVEYRTPDPTWVFNTRVQLATAVEKAVSLLLKCLEKDKDWTTQCFDGICKEMRLYTILATPTVDRLTFSKAWTKDFPYYASHMEKQAA